MADDDVLFLVDEEGRVAGWGHAAQTLFGPSAAEAVGQSVAMLMHKVSTDAGQRSGGTRNTAALLVKPALQGRSVVWQVLAADNPAPQDATVLEALFTHAPVALQILDDQLRVVRTSTPAGEQRGPAAGHVGAPFTETCGFAAPEEEAAVARRVLEGGEPVVNRLVLGAGVSAQHGRRIHSVSYLRLEEAGGKAVGLVTSVADVTERERARQRVAILETVRTRMGRRPHVMDVSHELAGAVVPDFADTALVEVAESAVRGEDPPLVPVGPGVLLRLAAAGGGERSAIPVGAVHPLPAGTPFSHVLSDLQPRLVSVGKDDRWPAIDPVRAGILQESADHSLIVAPLVLGEQVLGMISFHRHEPRDPFAEDDLAVASEVCAHAALCIDRACRLMREWITMSTVHRRIFPGQLADRSTIQLASLHVPGAEGGGAWSDAIALPGARVALIVGDVAGQGIHAAVTMGLLRTAIHTLASLDLQADELLARLSETTARLAAARAGLPPLDSLAREPLTAGCTVAIYNPVDLTCTIARAGLPEPVVIHPSGTSSTLPVPAGPALADPDTAPFPATTFSLPEGSTLAIGTTALAEEVLAPSGALRPLLNDACTTPLPELRDTIEQAYTHRDRAGETVMLLARTKALPAERVMTRALPQGPEAAPIARRSARRRLEAWGVDEETAFTNELIVSELVGNATRYGAPPLQLRLILDRMLTCEVSDAAPSAPYVKHARTVDESGRGLFIIASLAEQWGVRYAAEGKTVWAEQPAGSSTLLTGPGTCTG